MVWKILGAFAALLICVAIAAYGYVLGGWFTKKETVAAHLERVESGFDLVLPEAVEAPAPVAVLLPGCLGTRRHHRDWAFFLRQNGWASLTVDSFGPRGVEDFARLKAICEGARPWGFERAADIVAAILYLEQRPEIDSERIALFGWSNGAWAVMDALSFGPRSKPTNLVALDASWSRGVRAAVLFYPYCGFGSRSSSKGWTASPPAILFLPGQDKNILPETCAATAETLRSAGADIRTVHFDHDTHWFDNPEDFALLSHQFNPESVAHARRAVIELLSPLSTTQGNDE